jgi:hypothetical protein
VAPASVSANASLRPAAVDEVMGRAFWHAITLSPRARWAAGRRSIGAVATVQIS